MRSGAAAYLYPEIERSVVVELWKDTPVSDILNGSASGQDDVSEHVSRANMTQNSFKVTLTFDTEFLNCALQPHVGDLLTVKTDNTWRFIGIVDAIDSFHEERGKRSLSITSRTREAMGGWKSLHASSAIFPLGTGFSYILKSVCESLMSLDLVEYKFPSLTQSVPHTNVQFADETPWAMISKVLWVAGYNPSVNVLNQLTGYSKDITRVAAIDVPTERLISKSGAAQRISFGRIRLRWLDPKLGKSYQQSQLLYETSITAGFFKLKQSEETWWSDDHTQRAENIIFKIKDSVNSGIIPVASEDFEVKDDFHGEITLTTYWWVPTLYVMATVTLLATSNIPDMTQNVQVDPTTGTQLAPVPTSPTGRIAQTAAISTIMVIMMSLGVGRYEIWGTPFDYVHGKNTSMVVLQNHPAWVMEEKEVDNDLFLNEGQAKAACVVDLVHEAAKAYSFTVEMVDDPRIEVGDILKFEDNSRMLVLGFSNDFTRGAKATIKVSGIRA